MIRFFLEIPWIVSTTPKLLIPGPKWYFWVKTTNPGSALWYFSSSSTLIFSKKYLSNLKEIYKENGVKFLQMGERWLQLTFVKFSYPNFVVQFLRIVKKRKQSALHQYWNTRRRWYFHHKEGLLVGWNRHQIGILSSKLFLWHHLWYKDSNGVYQAKKISLLK